MLPLLKLISIGIKMCTEPIVGGINYIAQKRSSGYIRYFLIKYGKKIYYMETWINKRFIGDKTCYNFEEISEEDAVARSCSFFFEVFILYGIFFYWAINETLDSIEDNKQMKKNLDIMKEENGQMKKEIYELKLKMDHLNQRILEYEKKSLNN